ncbi:MAG: adenosylcobinamide-phosphate synthase CbiB [Lachnospiraceae bacterium]|nr:adenosylcobinamide-phosphate synthase CbiB [Lachnospiraceae bacterium]MDY5741557.1 adenosylcobinamide-phosphate synthase CbiB [Lachnospiraceae bacterium]
MPEVSQWWLVWLYLRPAVLGLAFGLDLLLGDPFGSFHPVVWIGRLISALIKRAERKKLTPKQGVCAGRRLVLLVLLATAVISGLLIVISYLIHPLCGLVIETWFAYQLLALRCLKTEAMKVQAALSQEAESEQRLAAGRTAVGRIVGRDVSQLDEAAVIRATVETVAENTTDGVIAPLLYLLLFGLPGMAVYKAINTMDSMVGYKNERFLHLGRAAARLDDVANFIPARLSALLLLAAGFGKRYERAAGWRIWRRDRRCHESPNSAQTESAVAGLLGIRLAGPAVYFGQTKEKPYIGDDPRPIEAADISRTCSLLYRAGTIALIMFMAVAAACLWFVYRMSV